MSGRKIGVGWQRKSEETVGAQARRQKKLQVQEMEPHTVPDRERKEGRGVGNVFPS